MDSAYFDSSVFIAIFKGEEIAKDIKALLRELRGDGCKVCTSIITIQEVSVLSYFYGETQADNYAKVDRIARIHGINREIALIAAKLEAEMMKRHETDSKPDRVELSRRRKIDCFHIATAVHLRCHWLYSADPHMLTANTLPSAKSVTFSKPAPGKKELFD